MKMWHYVWAGIFAVVGIGCIVVGIVGEALDTVYYLDTTHWFLIAIAVSVLSVSSMVTVLYHSQKQ